MDSKDKEIIAKGKVINVTQCYEVKCPICGELCRVEFTGDGADFIPEENCVHYVDLDYENEGMFKFKKNGDNT